MAGGVGESGIAGLSHLVVEVDDLDAARDFYAGTLGFAALGNDLWPDCGRSLSFAAAGGNLILAERKDGPDLADTGVHQAYAVAPAARAAVADRLAAAGVAAHAYREDRPAEAVDNFYFSDPAGNRVQLVARAGADGGPPGLDHAAVQVADLLWAEDFYARALGLPVEHRVGWSTADFARAKAWAEGTDDMAPGTRRMDKRYTTMVGKRTVPRVNAQVFLRAGAASLGVYLANRHFQEPPEEVLVGTPRTAFAIGAGALEAARQRLAAADWPHLGPVAHAEGPLAASLYFKDPGGNFIELATRRHEA